MIIFTGTGRSGTRYYSKVFETHQEFRAEELVGQFKALPHAYAPPTDLLADPQLRLQIMRRHLSGVDLATFRDSSNLYVHFLDALLALDPGVKIVLGVRDGRDFARSAITRGWHLPDAYRRKSRHVRAFMRQIADLVGYELPGRYWGFWVRPAKDDPWFPVWGKLSAIERAAWLWQWRNEKALERLAAVPRTSWTIVRLEDVMGDGPPPELRRLESFLGVKANASAVGVKTNDTQVAFRIADKSQWSAADSAGFYRIAGKTMAKFGYPVP